MNGKENNEAHRRNRSETVLNGKENNETHGRNRSETVLSRNENNETHSRDCGKMVLKCIAGLEHNSLNRIVSERKWY